MVGVGAGVRGRGCGRGAWALERVGEWALRERALARRGGGGAGGRGMLQGGGARAGNGGGCRGGSGVRALERGRAQVRESAARWRAQTGAHMAWDTVA